jgi:hypothetical protein
MTLLLFRVTARAGVAMDRGHTSWNHTPCVLNTGEPQTLQYTMKPS